MWFASSASSTLFMSQAHKVNGKTWQHTADCQRWTGSPLWLLKPHREHQLRTLCARVGEDDRLNHYNERLAHFQTEPVFLGVTHKAMQLVTHKLITSTG